MKKGRFLTKPAFLSCGRRDLNPYSFQNTPLKRARMPIPPRPHVITAEMIIPRLAGFVKREKQKNWRFTVEEALTGKNGVKTLPHSSFSS